MNEKRRKVLAKVKEKISDVRLDVGFIKDSIGYLLDEETNAYDSIPESLKESENGCQICENVDNLQSAYDETENVEESINEIEDYLTEVK